MAFTDIFGGNTIYPAEPTYLALSFSADTPLEWPVEQAISGDVLAAIIDAIPSSAGLSIIMPDARQGSQGYVSTFYNAGADDYIVKDAAGGTVMTVGSGEAWNLYLRDNTTLAGAWRIFQMGAGTSTVNAATLAGAGLEADGTTLNEEMSTSNHAANYVIVDADRATVQAWTGGLGDFTLPNPATVGPGWFVPIKNNGSGSVTVTPAAGTIDGSSSLILATLESAFFVSDGTNYYTVGFGQEVNSVFDFISLNVAGMGDFTLTGAQLNRIAYEFTGALTGNRNIIVPASVQQYWVFNNTSGAFSLTVKTAAGTGVTVIQGARSILYCDGTNVVNAETVSGLTFSNGSAASPSIAFASSPTTGFYRFASNAIGFATNGISRGSISSAGAWDLASGDSAVASTLTVNGEAGSIGVIRIESGFSMAAANPGLLVHSSAGAGFATISMAGGNNTAGTDDFALFQNGVNDQATIINRSGAAINVTVGSTNVAVFDDVGIQATLGLGNATTNIRINTLTQTTVGAAGAASALPAQPLGYATFSMNGTNVVIPYYLPV